MKGFNQSRSKMWADTFFFSFSLLSYLKFDFFPKMEQHLMRTEAWSEHLGRWRCHIQSVEHIEELECLQVNLLFLCMTSLLVRIATLVLWLYYWRSDAQKHVFLYINETRMFTNKVNQSIIWREKVKEN